MSNPSHQFDRKTARLLDDLLAFDSGQFAAPQPDRLDLQTPTKLFGVPLVNADLDGAARAIVARAARRERSIIHFLNAHCVNMLKTRPDYGRALAVADAVLPDGSGLALAGRLTGRSFQANLNGTDLFPYLCAHAAEEEQSIFLLGGAEGIAEAVNRNMSKAYPGLQIAGCASGYFSDQEEAALIDRINASGASILLVGMGVPLQEIWIARNRAKLTVPVIMGVGGLYDYYSNNIPRAPLALRKIGMEWSWRLLQEPRRLAGRYLIGNPVFVGHALAHAWVVRDVSDRVRVASKRGFDVLMSSLAILCLMPLLTMIALLIKLEDRGPIFFRQLRIGAKGKPFSMWKFRSMAADAEQRRLALLAQSDRDAICFKMKRDPRITKVGAVLRRFSLDELPQIFNILKGEMSIVGPRPALPQEVITYNERSRNRLKGMPGLTCTWQVSGRADIPFDDQVELDIRYLENPSLREDLKLIAKTLPAVVSGKGAY
jgi:exopolysaccharide biosynthesis WecB/TagA/CpsF family protein